MRYSVPLGTHPAEEGPIARPTSRTYVFAVEFRIPRSDRVGTVLERHQESLIDMGARYAFVYESIIEPGKVLVVIGIKTEQPLLNLLRSPYFFEWFDAVGVGEFPAVFAGATVERFDIGDPPPPGSDLVVAAIVPTADIEQLMSLVRSSLADFAKAGIRRTLVYRAFDNSHEVMLLQQLEDETSALHWAERSDIASMWLETAGIGAYPPVFIGRFVKALRFSEPTGVGLY